MEEWNCKWQMLYHITKQNSTQIYSKSGNQLKLNTFWTSFTHYCHWWFLSICLEPFYGQSPLFPVSINSATFSTSNCLFNSLVFSHLQSSPRPRGMFDGLMLLYLLSSKQENDCIHQALACLRGASGPVVLYSQTEQGSAGKRRKYDV